MPRKSSEIQFGSDSFLDVVCNIVGILIILIVIAGVRVSRAPVLRIAPEAPAIEEAPVTVAEPAPLVADVAEPIPDDTTELQQQLVALENEQAQLAIQLEQAHSQTAAAHEQAGALTDKLAGVRKSIDESGTTLKDVRQAVVSTTAELSVLRDQAARLTAALASAQQAPDQVNRVEHRISPVGKSVASDEVHFRVEHNRVAVVPLDELLQRLKDQIERRKDWLVKARQHEGQVGPVEGFTLRYLVQRDNLSVLDELRYGSGMYRISVAQWQLDMDSDARPEPVEVALRPGSRFYQAVLEAKPDAALTFWVYPDSFEAFTQLKAFCHEQNFLVAGRPLPTGFPIAGSPQGSRSSGQ